MRHSSQVPDYKLRIFISSCPSSSLRRSLPPFLLIPPGSVGRLVARSLACLPGIAAVGRAGETVGRTGPPMLLLLAGLSLAAAVVYVPPRSVGPFATSGWTPRELHQSERARERPHERAHHLPGWMEWRWWRGDERASERARRSFLCLPDGRSVGLAGTASYHSIAYHTIQEEERRGPCRPTI